MQEKAKYDILSLNVRGIRDQAKRRSIFLYLKDHNSKIYFLQETYSQPEDEIIWKNEWGGAGIRKAVRHARMAHKATKWPIKKILTGPVMRPDRTKLVK